MTHIPAEEYKKILETMPIACVDVVIAHNKKALLLCRKNEPLKNQWCFPGGRIHKNEKLEDAVKRKALEETGLKVRIGKKIGTYEAFFEKGPFEDLKTGVHCIAVCFAAKPYGNDIKINRTSLEHKWFDHIDEKFHPYVKAVLKDACIFD